MRRWLCILLLMTMPVFAGKKKPMGALFRKADQRVEIPNADVTLNPAKRKCENYAWAAIVESMMLAQRVSISQDDWAIKTSNGMKCFPALDDFAQRATELNGDYTLSDGKKVRIHADFIDGTPSADAMIYSLRSGRPLMVIWRGRPYLLYGLMYDEMIHSGGENKQYIIREMQLLDAALPRKVKERMVTLKKNDDADQIPGVTGVMQIGVEPRNFYDIPQK